MTLEMPMEFKDKMISIYHYLISLDDSLRIMVESSDRLNIPIYGAGASVVRKNLEISLMNIKKLIEITNEDE